MGFGIKLPKIPGADAIGDAWKKAKEVGSDLLESKTPSGEKTAIEEMVKILSTDQGRKAIKDKIGITTTENDATPQKAFDVLLVASTRLDDAGCLPAISKEKHAFVNPDGKNPDDVAMDTLKAELGENADSIIKKAGKDDMESFMKYYTRNKEARLEASKAYDARECGNTAAADQGPKDHVAFIIDGEVFPIGKPASAKTMEYIEVASAPPQIDGKDYTF